MSQKNSEGTANALTQKSATESGTMSAVGFGAKPTPTAHKKYGETISRYRQNGQNPTKNPKPSFHFIFGTEL